MSQELQDLFEQYGGNSYLFVSNRPFVERRIQNMKLEFDSLLKKISSTETYPLRDVIEEYSSKYPSQSFSNWFVTWGQNLLRSYQKLRRENICDSSKSGKVGKKRVLFPNRSSSGEAVKDRDNLQKEKKKKVENVEKEECAEMFEIVPLPDAAIPQVDLSQDQSLIVPMTKNLKKKDLAIDLDSSKKRMQKRVERSNWEEKIIVAEIPQEATEKQPHSCPPEVEINNDPELIRQESGIFHEFAKEIWRIFSPLSQM